MAAWYEERCHETIIFTYFLAREGLALLSNVDVEVARGTVLQEIRPGAGFKTGFSNKSWGGAP